MTAAKALVLEPITLEARDLPGANLPPAEAAPSPFEAHRLNIEGLFEEAKNFADGEPIQTQGQADAVQALIRMIQEAERAADDSRKDENKPFDDGKKEVQARYAPLIADTTTMKGKTVLAVKACKDALRPWLLKLKEEQDAEAKRLRDEAEAAAQAARDALAASQASGDLAEREAAEEQVVEARKADQVASRAEAVKPIAKGYGRAIGLVENWVVKGFVPVELEDGSTLPGSTACFRHYWSTRREALEEFILELAATDARFGKHQVPGVSIVNEPRL